MISTKLFTHDTFPIPSKWIFENLLPIDVELKGQSLKIKSIFNPNDTDPSFQVYVNEHNQYKFIDFSTGHKGDGVDMVMLMYNITRQEAYTKIYNLFVNSGENIDALKSIDAHFTKVEWKVTNYKVRNWNENDSKFWLEYHINSNLLNRFNVRPLLYYVFEKKVGNSIEHLTFNKELCYGFFTTTGKLYKIYNPGEKKTKYIKVADYIQGVDQLEYKAPWLIIQSGLKDVMSFVTLNIPKIELIAGDSENNLIPKDVIEDLKSKYRYVSTLFDNDNAGRKSSLRYQEEYGIPPIEFTIEKDVAQCSKDHGVINTQAFMLKALQSHYNTYLK